MGGTGLVAQGGGGQGQASDVVGGAAGDLGGAGEDASALLQHEGNIDTGRDLDLGIVTPGGIGVRPALHAQAPVSGLVRGQAALVAVQARGDVRHAHAGALGTVGTDEDRGGSEAVVALAEDRGTYREDLADHCLGRPAPVLDHGEDLSNRDAPDEGERRRFRGWYGAGRGGGSCLPRCGGRGRGARASAVAGGNGPGLGTGVARHRHKATRRCAPAGSVSRPRAICSGRPGITAESATR